jgi:hypothetical protein
MSSKNPLDYLTASSLLMIIGVIIICVGIYFIKNEMTSSGVTMGRYGSPYGRGTLDGKGMVFCGVIFLGLGYILFDRKKRKKK